jgi:hypothetical protein
MENRNKGGRQGSALYTAAEIKQIQDTERRLKERTQHANGHAVAEVPAPAIAIETSQAPPMSEDRLAAGLDGNDRHFAASDLDLDVCPIPPKPGPLLYFQRMKGQECHTFTIYSKHLFGINVHYVGRRSSPHYRNEKKCPGCRAKNAKRWKGFLHCFNINLGQEVFLELTPHSAKSLLSQLGTKGELRGNRIQVKRTDSDNGRLLISVLTAAPNLDKLPEGKDPLPSLLKFWGIDELDPDGVADAGTHSHDFE